MAMVLDIDKQQAKIIIEKCKIASDAMNEILNISESNISDLETKKKFRRVAGGVIAGLYAEIELPLYDVWPEIEIY
jgi:hypothetical protein